MSFGRSPFGRAPFGRAPAVAGGGALTLTAATGSFTETGVAAGLKAARKVTAVQASYTLTGIATGLKAARSFAAALATYSLTGVSAGLKRGLMLSGATAAYTLTGIDVALNKTGNKSLTADTVVFAFTGNAANLNYAPLTVPRTTPTGAPGKRIKFNGRFYDSRKDRYRLARDVDDYLSEKQGEQPKAQKKKRKVIKTEVAVIAAPPVVLDTREIDELTSVLQELKARDSQLQAYIAQLRAMNEALAQEDEEFLMMVA